MATQTQPTISYTYASSPHAAPSKRSRSKYREDDGDLSVNIMFDKRVIRGNTHAAKVITSNIQSEIDRIRQENERRARLEKLSKRAEAHPRAYTPPPVEGREHMGMQTETYLEALSDRHLEVDAETQTSALMDRPMSPLFIPVSTGTDISTQIEENDLFDFNLEVEPLLQVIVGKTIRNAMLELMQEEELEALHRQQIMFEDLRNAELAEVQRLEAQALRKVTEKNRRLVQEKERETARKALEEKVTARGFAKTFLSQIHASVFETLRESGFFVDPVKEEVEQQFLPGLFRRVCEDVSMAQASEILLRDLLTSAVKRAKEVKEENDKRIAHTHTLMEMERERARVEALAKLAVEKENLEKMKQQNDDVNEDT